MQIILCSLLVLLSFNSFSITVDDLPIRSVAVKIGDSEDLTLITAEKAFFSAGQGVTGYASKLSVKGIETALKIKKGTVLEFYVRCETKALGHAMSIVKMTVTEKKRLAESSELTKKTLSVVSFDKFHFNQEKMIFRLVLKDTLDVGTYCISFKNYKNGHFEMGGNLGQNAHCFEIIE